MSESEPRHLIREPGHGREFITEESRKRILDEAREVLGKTIRWLLDSAAYERSDRLWPAEDELFRTNPLSLGYGACGPALLLHAVDQLPKEVGRWLQGKQLSSREYPPSLYVGLAGISFAMDQLGYGVPAEHAMEILYGSRLKFEEPSMMLGAAGWGMVSLHWYGKTNEQVHLDWAIRAGEYICDTARAEGETSFWPAQGEDRVYYGFGYGASGIALFLLYLYLATGDREFRRMAVRALAFDLAHKVEDELGWNWQRYQGDSMIRPYWLYGGAGVGCVAVRFHEHLGTAEHLAVSRQIARSLFIKFTFTPGLFEGLTGIAEFMLDMYCRTGETAYLDRAIDMAESIQWFKVPQAHGLAWPGRWTDRISSDYSSGAAGIGLFFVRLLQPGPRLLLDLEFGPKPTQASLTN